MSYELAPLSMHLSAHWGTNAGGPTRTPFPLNLQQENSPHNLSVMWMSTLSSQKRRSNVKTIPAPRCISEEVGRGQICAWMIVNTTLNPPSRSMIIWHEWGELAKSKPSQIWSWLFFLPSFNQYHTQRDPSQVTVVLEVDGYIFFEKDNLIHTRVHKKQQTDGSDVKMVNRPASSYPFFREFVWCAPPSNQTFYFRWILLSRKAFYKQ